MSPLNRRILAAVVVLGVVAGGALTYRFFLAGNANAVSNGPARTPPAQPVTAATVVEKAVPVQLSAIGTVQPVHAVAVRTRLDSQIARVLVQDGQRVEAGQPLFELDARQLEAQRQQAEAVLARDEAQLAYARRNMERKQPQISSAAAIDEARTNVTALQAAVRADRASLENLAVQRSYTRILAPIAGRLGTIEYKAGSIVKASDAQPLVTINQLRPIYVAFSVPQTYLGRIQAALAEGAVMATATMPETDAAPQQGRVAYLENAVDASTGTISVRAEFPNARERLWPGAYVNVAVTLRTDPHALVVPAPAVQQGQDGIFVFVIKEDSTVEARNVTVDRTLGEEAVVSSGLRVGERVVVDGQLRLVKGARVEVKAPKAEGRQ
jgi:multidrug efflux system membrane fusion protein